MLRTSLLLLVALACSSTLHASEMHFEGFENPGWTAGMSGNWQNFGGATITRVPSGTAGIPSSGGSAGHAVLTPGTGPYTTFGGYSSVFGNGHTASLDVYLDTSWSEGSGFDYSVAASKQDGGHLRDFIFHVGVTDEGLLVNASNNTDNAFNDFKLENENGGNYFEVTSDGWYTLQQEFFDDNAALAVEFSLIDAFDNVLWSVIRSNVGDDIATIVGGNRYGWFTYNNIDGLAIDNASLQPAAVPEPASLAVWSVLGLTGLAYRKRRSTTRSRS